jgi:hypothetical protein
VPLTMEERLARWRDQKNNRGPEDGSKKRDSCETGMITPTTSSSKRPRARSGSSRFLVQSPPAVESAAAPPQNDTPLPRFARHIQTHLRSPQIELDESIYSDDDENKAPGSIVGKCVHCRGRPKRWSSRNNGQTARDVDIQAGTGIILSLGEERDDSIKEELQERLFMAREEISALIFAVEISEQRIKEVSARAPASVESLEAAHREQLTELRWAHMEAISKLEDELDEAEARAGELVNELTAQLKDGLQRAISRNKSLEEELAKERKLREELEEQQRRQS